MARVQKPVGKVNQSSVWDAFFEKLAEAVNGLVSPKSYTIATLPNADPAGRMIFISDEMMGPGPAYSDGTDWRRFSDGAVVSA
jgi:hypothetical protein